MLFFRRSLFATLGLTLAWLVTVSATQQIHAESFPALTLKPLAGNQALRLPHGQAGHRVLIALGFEPKDQSLLEQGMTQAQSLKQNTPLLSIIEIPVVEPKYQPYRVAVEGFMKQQVRHKPYLSQVYPVYRAHGPLKQRLSLPAATRVAFLLCDEAGQPLWKVAHPLTSQDLATIRQLLIP